MSKELRKLIHEEYGPHGIKSALLAMMSAYADDVLYSNLDNSPNWTQAKCLTVTFRK